ncbi:hypothetical protein BJ508DRAFT_410906 [Ascobolus immersus RN42]|uniref:Uncharacterized protein n=1 Tax=Ascobolus immersus RN42 TaxID=1160509 RepID=A0A3N4ILX8_ASCIM|nr:hypothetical protein BJ508DRAFT_410906 [Ascobolus immersus RN42]
MSSAENSLQYNAHSTGVGSQHMVYRIFLWENDESILIAKRSATDNKIDTVSLLCRSTGSTKPCDGTCLLMDAENPGEQVENCPIPGCACPDYPTIEHIKEHLEAPMYLCQEENCLSSTLEYGFFSERGLTEHVKQHQEV